MKQTVEEAAKEYSLQWAWNSQPDMWQSEKDFKAGWTNFIDVDATKVLLKLGE